MSTLPKTIGAYFDEFNKAAESSPQAGAERFLNYVSDQINAGGYKSQEAFNFAVHNTSYYYGNNAYLGTLNKNGLPNHAGTSVDRASELLF